MLDKSTQIYTDNPSIEDNTLFHIENILNSVRELRDRDFKSEAIKETMKELSDDPDWLSFLWEYIQGTNPKIPQDKVYFDDYSDSWMSIVKKIYGAEEFTKLKRGKLEPYQYKGIDITYPFDGCNVKDTFKKDNVEYYNERQTPLEVLFRIAFQFGMQQCWIYKVAPLEHTVSLTRLLIKQKVEDFKNSGKKIEI